MANHSGWHPASQVCAPPPLPAYLKNVYDLKPIVGVPSDEEIIGIHTVMQAANRVSTVPGMHDPGLLMRLADHLFSVQIAKYRGKYSLLAFPSNATYTPPSLPAHISVTLGTVSGVPTNEEMIKVQEAVRSYQQFSHVPSMFDAQVNMELTQHLFDLQMARYTQLASEYQPSSTSQTTTALGGSVRSVQPPNITEGAISATNNAGTGVSAAGVHLTSSLAPTIDTSELMERPNQLAARFNLLLERSNELAERSFQPTAQASQPTERINEVFERLGRLEARVHQPVEQSDRLTERFNQMLERFSEAIEQMNQPVQQINQHAGQFRQSTEQSTWLAEQMDKHAERIGDVMQNINRVLVGIQHAIVRNHRENTVNAVYCLVNEAGEVLGASETSQGTPFMRLFQQSRYSDFQLPVAVDGDYRHLHMQTPLLGEWLSFFGIGDGLCDSPTSTVLKEGEAAYAKDKLSDYLSSCLG
ncbi:unnamed protein product [Rhizoctonia solani]|uniref:Laminin domain protein n=1 Tax=Rhizoctonia solani TaxID=456999 RepID=A0A8H3DHJ4_9AGAM|nr:unnamed protein product [Rhizoctonia solani]